MKHATHGHRLTTVATLAAFAVLSVLSAPLAGRTWTNKAGKKIEAGYVSSNGETVTVRRKGDGRIFSIPLATLSEEDVAFVTTQRGDDTPAGSGVDEDPEAGDGRRSEERRKGKRYGYLMKGDWVKASHSDSGQNLPFQIYGPNRLGTGKAYPLVIFLHGKGSGGTDNEKQMGSGAYCWAEGSFYKKNASIIIAPQAPDDQSWEGAVLEAMLDLVDELVRDLPVDKDRIYITGLSMGGYGSWSALAARPKLFAAAVPVCGGGNPGSAKKFRDVPIWVFHGDADEVVKVEQSRVMVEALKDAGSKVVKYSELPGVGHNAWDTAYSKEKDEVREWVFAQKR